MAKRRTDNTPFFRTFFLLYAMGMLYLLFGRTRYGIDDGGYWQTISRNVNFIPFYTIRNYMHIIRNIPQSPWYTHCIVNLSGNILLFIPIGYLLPRIFVSMHSFFRFAGICLGAVFLVEIVQLLTLLGSFDVDDIILNMAGALLGHLIWSLKKR